MIRRNLINRLERLEDRLLPPTGEERILVVQFISPKDMQVVDSIKSLLQN
jgi:hypothetical protein